MYKSLLALAALSVSPLFIAGEAVASERSDIWSCVDASTLEIKEDCMMDVIDTHTNDSFYSQFKETTFVPKSDAFATITHFPEQNLIVVKSLEAKISKLVKQENTLLAANY